VTCANCGRAFDGRFCPDCGQEAVEIRRPIGSFVREFLSDTFAFDARIWRTIPLLVRRPGKLSSAYVTGQRVRFVPPLRLYVFLSALFFAVLSLTDGGPLRFAVQRSGDSVTLVSAYGIQLGATGTSQARAGSLDARLDQASNDVDRLNGVVIATLSYAHFLALPALALVLMLLWRRRWFSEHLVFGMFFLAYMLLTGCLIILVYGLAGNPAPGGLASSVAIGAWNLGFLLMLYPAVRDMYGTSHRSTIARYLILVPAWLVVVTGVVIVATLATVWVLY
jgi:hypothetical protein